MKKIKVHSLTGRITPLLMRQAFQAVRRNRGAAGVDKVSVDMFDANLEENLASLMRDLKTGNGSAAGLWVDSGIAACQKRRKDLAQIHFPSLILWRFSRLSPQRSATR